MTSINPGQFKGDKYIKFVSFSRAVLWKSREISLSAAICNQFKSRGTKFVIFEDKKKKERWSASVDLLRSVKVFKQEGQEAQFYFPISAFKKESFDEKQMGAKGKEVSTPRDDRQGTLDIHTPSN